MASDSRRARRTVAWWQMVERLVAECSAGRERDRSYWAQQLAYGPIVPGALSLWLRDHELTGVKRDGLLGVVELALGGLDALPDDPGIDRTALARVARRQADALALGRRRRLQRLALRLGRNLLDRAPGTVPPRMLRPYPLISWDPPDCSPSCSSSSGVPGESGQDRRHA